MWRDWHGKVKTSIKCTVTVIAVTVIDRNCSPAEAAGIFAARDDSTASAAGWIEGTLLGSVGTTVAVIAIAGLGMAMLQGHVSPRRAIQVVLGCFILFGAPTIARGLVGLGQGASGPVVVVVSVAAPSDARPAPKANADPYAGASVPM